MTVPNLSAARTIVDANAYMTLATADAAGTPWASPVWFAHRGDDEFVWVSRPTTRHSRNIADRPDIAIAIFDSTAPIGTGVGVYLSARAAIADDRDVSALIRVFSDRSVAQGGAVWSPEDLQGDAAHRLYVAHVEEMYILDEHDQRVRVS